MAANLLTRIEQLQAELDEAQRIAHNNYRLYTQAREQRDELLEALKALYDLTIDMIGDDDAADETDEIIRARRALSKVK